MIRLPAAHRWPALLNADSTAACAARSRSASSHTTSGFLPPSSRQVLTSREPVDAGDPPADRRGAGEAEEVDVGLDERGAGLGAVPVHEVQDAGRHAGLVQQSARSGSRCSGVSSDGLSTAALPHSSAGKTFHA